MTEQDQNEFNLYLAKEISKIYDVLVALSEMIVRIERLLPKDEIKNL